LQCECGKIRGEIQAIKEDSMRLDCYCEDCRNYATFVAKEGKRTEKTIGPCGENRLIQVCKSAITIHQGENYLQLARQAPDQGMHRYYAGCCHVPMFNTIDSLGYVGVYRDYIMDEDDDKKEQQLLLDKFAGPVAYKKEQALKTPETSIPDVSILDFLWKLLRYAPYYKCGPFNYNLEPKYWGVSK